MPNIKQQKKRVRVAARERLENLWIDKAAAHGALHKNTAARKKSQAARLASGGSD
jgi:ribosomal protein S20